MDSFTLSCLEFLSDLLANDEVIAEFFSELPAPTYNLARYTDWIRPYLEKQLQDAAKYSGSGSKEKEEKITKVMSLYEKYEVFLDQKALKAGGLGSKLLSEEQQEGQSTQPREQISDQVEAEDAQPKADSPQINSMEIRSSKPYVILEALEERVVHTQDIDGMIELSVTQVSCAYAESRPTGVSNLSLVQAEPGQNASSQQESES